MLNSHEPDPCCGDDISEALRSGDLDDLPYWVHDDCGTEWRPTLLTSYDGGNRIRHWSPHPAVAIV